MRTVFAVMFVAAVHCLPINRMELLREGQVRSYDTRTEAVSLSQINVESFDRGSMTNLIQLEPFHSYRFPLMIPEESANARLQMIFNSDLFGYGRLELQEIPLTGLFAVPVALEHQLRCAQSHLNKLSQPFEKYLEMMGMVKLKCRNSAEPAKLQLRRLPDVDRKVAAEYDLLICPLGGGLDSWTQKSSSHPKTGGHPSSVNDLIAGMSAINLLHPPRSPYTLVLMAGNQLISTNTLVLL